MRGPHVSPDMSWEYELFPLQTQSCFTTCHGPFPVILARTDIVTLDTVACIIDQRHRSLAGRLKSPSRAIRRRTHTVSSCGYRFAHKNCISVSFHQHRNIGPWRFGSHLLILRRAESDFATCLSPSRLIRTLSATAQ